MPHSALQINDNVESTAIMAHFLHFRVCSDFDRNHTRIWYMLFFMVHLTILIALTTCISYYMYGLFLCDIQVCILRMEINQASGDQSVWHHNVHSLWHHKGNDIVRNTHCEITMGNDVARHIQCDVIMSNDVVMCTLYLYHGITIYNELLQTSFIMYYYA